MPLYRVAPTRQLPHTIDLIQRSGMPRFANEIERDEQYPDPEIGALAVINTTLEVFNGSGWIPVGGAAPTLINMLQDVDARFPPNGAVLTWSSAAQAWGWSMPYAPPVEEGWCDHFDGGLDGGWSLGAYAFNSIDLGETVALFTADSGSVVAPAAGVSSPQNVASMMRTAPTVADAQWIEAVIDNFFQDTTGGFYTEIQLANFVGAPGSATSAVVGAAEGQRSRVSAIIGWDSTDGFRLAIDGYQDGGGYFNADTLDHVTEPAEPFTVRLESYADGQQILKLNGATMIDSTFGPVGSGQQQNVWCYWDHGVSPRIDSVCGGPL